MFNLDFVLNSTQGRLWGVRPRNDFNSVSTDTRTIQVHSLFLALRGERFNGHEFVHEAFKKGASGIIVDEEGFSEMKERNQLENQPCIIIVKNVYDALADIGRAYRKQFRIPLIAITGSSGKTTTKECVGKLFGLNHRVRVGSGNFNNHIGLPLNLLQLQEEDQFAVFEMGANRLGEIEYLCGIAEPGVGILTCVMPAHLKGFGSLEGVYQAKLELAKSIQKNKGVLFVTGDDPFLVKKAKEICSRVKTFGKSSGCDFILSDLQQEENYLSFRVNQIRFRLKGNGIFNAMNASAALSVAHHFGMNLKDLADRWTEFVSVPNRFEIEELPLLKVKLVKDCYNANPGSFSAALDAFFQLPATGKRIIVSGDMKELGGETENYHRALGTDIGKRSADLLISVGEFACEVVGAAERARYGMPALAFANNKLAAEFLMNVISAGDLILLKGSRGAKLEEIAEIIKQPLANQVS